MNSLFYKPPKPPIPQHQNAHFISNFNALRHLKYVYETIVSGSRCRYERKHSSCRKRPQSAIVVLISKECIVAKNPPHKRTRATEQRVTDLLKVGVPLSRIGSQLGIGEQTLRRRYSDVISAAGLRRGQRKFDPTPLQRDLVKRLAAVGIPQAEIASFIKVSRSTLLISYHDICLLCSTQVRLR
jgi:hypothetical protein